MSSYKHYPLGSFPGQDFWFSTYLPDTLDPNKKYMLIAVCPGQGEAEGNIGDMHSCVRIATHGMFENLRDAVDVYPIILIFVNTPITSKYKNKEAKKCINWAKANLPIDEKNIWLFGHSLGWWGAGNYGFTDPELAAMVRGTFVSASGPYTASSTLWANMENNDTLVWGAVALNDTAMGTAPVHTQKIYNNLPKNKVMIFEFPASRYPDQEQAHNSMAIQLSKLTGLEMNPDMVRGGLLHTTPVMNIYEWALSNPKGSVYQYPDKPFTGPKFPTDVPTSTPDPVVVTPPVQAPPVQTPPVVNKPPRKIRGYNIYGDNIKIQPMYTDGPGVNQPIVKGDEITVVWIEEPKSATLIKKKSGTHKL